MPFKSLFLRSLEAKMLMNVMILYKFETHTLWHVILQTTVEIFTNESLKSNKKVVHKPAQAGSWQVHKDMPDIFTNFHELKSPFLKQYT